MERNVVEPIEPAASASRAGFRFEPASADALAGGVKTALAWLTRALAIVVPENMPVPGTYLKKNEGAASALAFQGKSLPKTPLTLDRKDAESLAYGRGIFLP
jgi:hypothetical protein